MNKNLILLATAFPYGNGEAYLETEVKYYDAFDSVQIFSLNILKNQRDHQRKLPSKNFKVFPVYRAKGFVYILYAFVALTDKNLYVEIGRLIRERQFNFKRLVKLFIYISRAHRDADKIKRYLKKNKNDIPKEGGVIYSYRFEYQAYVALLIQKYLPGFTTVSRGHRYDLYEEENNEKYIPLREVLMRDIYKIVMISDDGKNYLSRKYPEYENKIVVSRLGTATYPVKKTGCPNGFINVVSCSNVISVKRLDLLIKSLALVKNVKVHWTHYGDGALLGEMKELCLKLLGENITWNFCGAVPNEQILKNYSEVDYHLFVNVSSSEGIPVSIMEAMSFGIPCIATDVGGTNEIIENGKNGILLDPDFNPKELATCIEEFAQMEDGEYQEYRKSARSTWGENYSADVNYPEFIKMIQEI